MSSSRDINALEALYEERKRTYHMLLTLSNALREEPHIRAPTLALCSDMLKEAEELYLLASDEWYSTTEFTKNKGGHNYA